jgi:hypothetical protein
MAFSPQFEPDEVLQYDISVRAERTSSLRMQLTNRAAYWAATKRFAVVDDIRTARASISSIQSIRFGLKRRFIGPSIGIGIALVFLIPACALLVARGEHGAVAFIPLFISASAAYYAYRKMKGLSQHRAISVVSGQDTLHWVEPYDPLTLKPDERAKISVAIETLRKWADENKIKVDG